MSSVGRDNVGKPIVVARLLLNGIQWLDELIPLFSDKCHVGVILAFQQLCDSFRIFQDATWCASSIVQENWLVQGHLSFRPPLGSETSGVQCHGLYHL